MRIISVRGKPYTIINGKDFSVVRWFDPGRHGPLFIQIAGRTALTREDLPTDDWIVHQTREKSLRIATAWRKPWFDYKPDATRKLAFVGASSEGSFFLLLRYLTRRFGITVADADLANRASLLASGSSVPYDYVLDRARDSGLTDTTMALLDVPPHFDADAARQLLTSEP